MSMIILLVLFSIFTITSSVEDLVRNKTTREILFMIFIPIILIFFIAGMTIYVIRVWPQIAS